MTEATGNEEEKEKGEYIKEYKRGEHMEEEERIHYMKGARKVVYSHVMLYKIVIQYFVCDCPRRTKSFVNRNERRYQYEVKTEDKSRCACVAYLVIVAED